MAYISVTIDMVYTYTMPDVLSEFEYTSNNNVKFLRPAIFRGYYLYANRLWAVGVSSTSTRTLSYTGYSGSYPFVNSSQNYYFNNSENVPKDGVNYSAPLLISVNANNVTAISSDLPIFNDFNEWWEYITSPSITYTWQSVAGVSGKGQTYSLSQIASASINNGESVTGASASAFTSLIAQVSTMVTDDSAMSGADAGGISGSGTNSGNQSSGYAFGQGESGTNVSGGGGGYYGGEKGGSLLSGGAGSGYIGNSLVSNKKMVGYNVPTSSAEGTKTESVNVYSATKEANKPKAGNGFARVKFVRDIIEDEDSWYTVETRVGTWIDGKPIYQILFVGVNKTLTRNWDNLVDVSPLNIDEVLYIDLLGVSNSDYYGSLVAIQGAQVGLSNDYIVGYKVNTNITPYVTKAKIRYTKTTDT